MNLELNEKIFLVTGASRGIGRAIAKGLLQEGAKVAILARQELGVIRWSQILLMSLVANG